MRINLIGKLFQRRLFWVLSGVLPLVIFAAVMLVLFTQQQEKAIRRLLDEAASNAAHAVERAIGEQVGLLNGLAASRSLDSGDFAAFRLDAQRLWDMHPEWRTLILTNEREPVFNLRYSPRKLITPLRDPGSLKRVWETRKPFVGDLANGYVAIRVPVIRDKRMVNTLVAPTDPQFFRAAISASQMTQQWRFVIAGSDNVVISVSTEAPVAEGQPLPPSFLQMKPYASVFAGLRYASPVSIMPGGWRIFVFAPAASVEAPFAMKRLIVFFGGGLAALLTAILVLALSSAWASKQETIRLHEEIEERARAQKELQESEQRFRLLVENAPDAVFVQTEGRFAYLNHAAVKFFGARHADELIGLPVIERFHPDCRDLVRERIRLLNEERKPVARMLEVCLRLDGTSIEAEASAVPFEYGGKHGALTFERDMTESLQARARQKELEAQLHQAQKMESVGRLAGGVAHDYNNMLSVILGYAELAMEEVEPGDALHADLKEILEAARRSTEITRQLLAFARKQTIAPRVLDLNETVEGMLKMLRRLIGEDIDLAWLPEPGLWPVKMDPAQIDQILANLCVNARDAIVGVGKVTIETDKATFDTAYCADHAGFVPGEFVLLAVSDDGCGMDKETLEKIFEPFFTTKEVGRGTGLGLATVYGIVKQNDGFINVYSEPGKGTTFKIYLPRHGGQADGIESQSVAQIPLSRGETVLIVEDEPAIMKMGGTMLKKLGYRVLAAGTPSEALRLAREHPGRIHLLITDVVMPEMNGRDLADRLSALYPDIKTLFMSGYTANVIAHRGVLEEGVNFIQKPFSRKDLAFKVRAALGNAMT